MRATMKTTNGINENLQKPCPHTKPCENHNSPAENQEAKRYAMIENQIVTIDADDEPCFIRSNN